MIPGLIILILIVVFMAFFIGNNIGNNCTFWFFNTFENIPVSVLVLSAFAAGIAFALICLLIIKITKSINADREDRRVRKVEKKIRKENKLNQKKSLLKKAEEIEKNNTTAPEEEVKE